MKLAGEAQAELIKWAMIGGAVLLVGWYAVRKGSQAFDAIADTLAAPGQWIDENIVEPVKQNVAESRAEDRKRLDDYSATPYDEMVNQGIPGWF